jgi:hypothetical protein
VIRHERTANRAIWFAETFSAKQRLTRFGSTSTEMHQRFSFAALGSASFRRRMLFRFGPALCLR